MEYGVGNVDCLYLHVQCPCDVSEIKELFDCGEHGCDRVAWVANRLLGGVLLFKEIMLHQLTAVFLYMHEYSCHGVVYVVCGPVADIRQICFLKRAKYLLYERLFHSRHLT